MLTHFWEQRALARIIFSSALFFKLSRKLADMIEPRLDNSADSRLEAVGHASQILGVIKAWLAGDFSATAETLAANLSTQR